MDRFHGVNPLVLEFMNAKAPDDMWYITEVISALSGAELDRLQEIADAEGTDLIGAIALIAIERIERDLWRG